MIITTVTNSDKEEGNTEDGVIVEVERFSGESNDQSVEFYLSG